MNAHQDIVADGPAPRAAPAAAVTIEGVSKTFPPVAGRSAQPVLRNVAIQVEPGSFLVVSGPSGCGKSTLLNMIAGLDGDFDGTIRFGTIEPRLAFIFQSPRLLPWRTVAENIALALPDGDPRLANIPELLSRVGLSGAETAYPERLSVGMQRRAAIARGFVTEPDILLMDEPFVSLDDPTAEALRTLVAELWSRTKTTILFVTHDRTEAVRLATRIVRLGTLTDGMASSIVGDCVVGLSANERCDAAILAVTQARIFANP